jgi:hypothetical protein
VQAILCSDVEQTRETNACSNANVLKLCRKDALHDIFLKRDFLVQLTSSFGVRQ